MAYKSRNMASGTYTGTGSAITVVCGFRPKYIKLIDITQKTLAEWTESTTDAHAFLTVDSGVGTTDISEISSAGITPNSRGFSIGTNASINTASDVGYFVALK